MVHNPKHFPTLLIVCILMSIIFYIVSNIVCFFHERKKSLNAQPSVTNGAALSTEEQQMANYLRDQEDK